MPASKLQRRLGTYITSSVAGETVRAFIPPPLPPVPELQLKALHQHLDRANQGLGRLNGMTRLLPGIRFLLYLYVRKEALVSSQIEGTQSSFADLLLFENDEAPHAPVEDVEEVSNYVAAMQHGGNQIQRPPKQQGRACNSQKPRRTESASTASRLTRLKNAGD